MAIKPSLLKNTNSIEAIQNSINAFGVSLRAANNTSSLIIRGFTESNRQKKSTIIRRRELFGKTFNVNNLNILIEELVRQKANIQFQDNEIVKFTEENFY